MALVTLVQCQYGTSLSVMSCKKKPKKFHFHSAYCQYKNPDTFFFIVWMWKSQKYRTSSMLRVVSCSSAKGTLQLTHRKLPRNAIRSLLSHGLLSLQVSQEAPQNPGLLLHSYTTWNRAVFTGMPWHKGPCPQVMKQGYQARDRTEAVTSLRCRALLYCSSHIKELLQGNMWTVLQKPRGS